MTCTRCRKPIRPGELHHRTSMGPHHRECRMWQVRSAVGSIILDGLTEAQARNKVANERRHGHVMVAAREPKP